MGQSEMDEHGSEQPPNFAMPNFRHAAKPRQEASFDVIHGKIEPENRFGVVTEARNQSGRDAEGNQDAGQESNPRPADGENLAPVVKSFFSGFIGFLFLSPFFLGDAGGPLIF